MTPLPGVIFMAGIAPAQMKGEQYEIIWEKTDQEPGANSKRGHSDAHYMAGTVLCLEWEII